MEKKLHRAFYIIPAIYLLITGFFFFKHYSQRTRFSQMIGTMELTGQSTKGTEFRPSEIKKLNIFGNGMNFLFDRNNNLILRTGDNIDHYSKLISFSSDDSAFILDFENDVRLRFTTDLTDNKISIEAELPQTAPPIKSVSFPIKEVRGFKLGFTEEDNTPVITNGESNFFLVLPSLFNLDKEHRNLLVTVEDPKRISFMIQETLVGRGRTAEKWYDQNEQNIDSLYDSALTNFVNNAFFGWNSRFSSKTGMWSDEEGTPRFDELTAYSYLSETLLRGSYKTARTLMLTSSEGREKELTSLTAPYLGDIVMKTNRLIEAQRLEKIELNNLLQQKNPSIIGKNEVVKAFLVNDMTDRLPLLAEIALNFNENEEVSTSLDRLKVLTDLHPYLPDSMEVGEKLTEIVENSLLPFVSWLDEGLFLELDGQVTIEESFDLALLLTRTGRILKNDFYMTVGKKMLISLLERARESAFIPAMLIIEENKIVKESGSLHPELFYNQLVKNPYLEKQSNLRNELGTDSWLLTVAEEYKVSTDGRETNISIKFPKGSTHHFALKGIKPFTRLYMKGVNFRSDVNFQRYTSGWVYDKRTQTLYVKLKQSNDVENIKILYYYPETKPAASATSNNATDSEKQNG